MGPSWYTVVPRKVREGRWVGTRIPDGVETFQSFFVRTVNLFLTEVLYSSFDVLVLIIKSSYFLFLIFLLSSPSSLFFLVLHK